jgi:predicted kinase
MVCAELERLAEWATLPRLEQLQLLFTALLHDAGKPQTTFVDPESGRTRSPRHSLVGEAIARRVLRELGCDLVTRETIAALVRFHGRPPYLLEKSDPEREVIATSCYVSNRLLYLFALADTRGRKTSDMGRPEENLGLWRLLAEEQKCLDQPYAFANDQARFLFFRDQLSSLHYTPHEHYRCTVTMLTGLPGAGKDTWLAQNHPQLPVVSLDAVREELEVDAEDNQGTVIQTAREQCRVHLRQKTDFAFNATNITRLTRRRWIDLFADYDARIQIAYLEPPMSAILSQNKQRSRQVPEAVIWHLAEKLEPPTIAEAHAVEFVASK